MSPEKTMTPSWLITGASGLLGTSLRHRLLQEDGIRAAGQSFQHPAPDTEVCDIREESSVADLVQRIHPQVVVHTAAYRDPDFCEEHPEEAYRLNEAPVEYLVGHMPPGARLIHISTDYVFRGDQAPYRETDTPDPCSVYGASKRAAEQKALERPGSVVLRIPVLIGPNPRPGQAGFLQQMMAQILDDTREIEVDDVLIRHPTWTRDIADVIRWLARHPDVNGIVHASSQDGDTRYALSKRVAAVMGHPADHLQPSTRILPRKAQRPKNSHILNTVLENAGGPRFHAVEDMTRDALQAGDWPHG